MSLHRRAVLLGTALLAMSITTFAQQAKQGQRNPEERRAAIAAAAEALGLSADQQAKIREIRRERAPEGTTGRDRREWRAGQTAKIRAVLTDEQKAKVDEIKEAGESKALEGAILFGFVPRQPAGQ